MSNLPSYESTRQQLDEQLTKGTMAAPRLEENTSPQPELRCRVCQATLPEAFLSLGLSPIANNIPRHATQPEVFYPLQLYVCHHCWSVQLPNVVRAEELFTSEYPYFSSFSSSWLAHAKASAEHHIDRYQLNDGGLVVELASNDGYLLQYFKEGGIPVCGIDPCNNVADAAITKGIPTEKVFFGEAVAHQLLERFQKKWGTPPSLVLGNNVLAHVPDVVDFVKGLAVLLQHGGTATLEFPSLAELMANGQFDTIYHEHYSYWSLTAANQLFSRNGLQLVDVEHLSTHGGSFRVHVMAQTMATGKLPPPPSEAVLAQLQKEVDLGLTNSNTYQAFADKLNNLRQAITQFVVEQHAQGLTVAGYGAPAKCATLLHSCGLATTNTIQYTVDRNPNKQGGFLPGSRIPILAPQHLVNNPPDVVIIFPWNIASEIKAQLADQLPASTRLAVLIPEPGWVD